MKRLQSQQQRRITSHLHLHPRLSSTFTYDVIPPSLTPSSPTTPTPSPPSTTRQSAFLYYNSVFPIRMGVWDIRYLTAHLDKSNLLQEVKNMIPEDSIYSTKVDQVWPREKDGGAFIKLNFELPKQPFVEEVEVGKEKEMQVARALKVIEEEARVAILAKGTKLWWLQFFSERNCFLVKGKPWMEDMNRFPNSTLRIEFEGPEIPQEELYELFRPYGKIHNIYPQPSASKDLPKYANIAYSSIRSATAARNCLHGSIIPSTLPTAIKDPPTLLRILYADRVRAHYVRDWITNHPRISLPLFVALLGGISWAVFDPVREVMVKNKISGTWDAGKWEVVKWLRRETLGRLGLVSVKGKEGTSTGIEKEREDAKELLGNWLKDVPDTFIVVTGPRGSGKTGLVDQVTSGYSNVLTIDCAAICKQAKTETKLVSELATAIGYWPQFVLGSSINNLIDLASVGLIGQKAGFSATLDTQLKQILEVASSALKSLSSDRNHRIEKQAKKLESLRSHASEKEKVVEQFKSQDGIRDGRIDTVSGNGVMSELGAGIEKGAGEGLVIAGPESSAKVKSYVDAASGKGLSEEKIEGLPVIVIKNFAMKGESKQEVLWDVLAEWAAVLVENQVAHVIFTSESVLVTKPLAKALPSKPFNTIALNDASPDSALQYVQSKLSELDSSFSLSPETKSHVAKLGGRLTDLELLVQKIKAGLNADEAVDDIVMRNATEIRKNFFGDSSDSEEVKSWKWNRGQAWSLIKGLAKNDELKYADVLVNPPFKSNEAALRALETAEMISVHHRDGRPSVIRPSKPVYQSAFRQLLSDTVFAALVEYQINLSATATATEELNVASKSLIELSQLFGGGKWAFGGGSSVPKEIEIRVTGLLGEMGKAETKLEKLEKQKVELFKVLAEAV